MYTIEYFDNIQNIIVKHLGGARFFSKTSANEEIIKLQQLDEKNKEQYGLIRRTKYSIIPKPTKRPKV